MVSKEQNLGGRAYVVDSIKELRPTSSNIISRLNGSINSVVQNNTQQQDQIVKNFSLVIEGDTTIGYKVADDGKTIINETALKAVVTYRRGLGAMQVTAIPDSAFKWVSFDKNEVVATGSTATLSLPSTYIVSVETEFLLSSVEPSLSNTIQLKLTSSVSIQYGTISLYTYSDAETRDELLLSLDNLRWYTNPYDIERNAKFIWRKDSSDGGKTWIYFRMEYEGPQGPPGTGGEGGSGSLIVEYQYSDSDREAPLKYIPFIFGGARVNFKGGNVGDRNDEDWMANPPKKGKYKWMRVSTDGGKTWTYSVVTGPEPSFFDLDSSKDEFRQNERGAVDVEDTLKFWVTRRNIPNESKTNWVVTPEYLLPNQDLIHEDQIIINVPVGFDEQSFTVSATIGMYSEVRSRTITGMPQGTYSPKKLRTIDRSIEPPEPFPTTLDDGVSPLVDGDYCLVIIWTDNLDHSKGTNKVPYRYSGALNPSTGTIQGWEPLNTESENWSQIMGNVSQEILAGSSTIPVGSMIYGYIQNLFADRALINMLSTKEIELLQEGTEIGTIHSVGYNKGDITQHNKQGIYIDGTGYVEIQQANLKDVNIISKDSLGNSVLETVSGYTSFSHTSNETGTYWKLSDVFTKDTTMIGHFSDGSTYDVKVNFSPKAIRDNKYFTVTSYQYAEFTAPLDGAIYPNEKYFLNSYSRSRITINGVIVHERDVTPSSTRTWHYFKKGDKVRLDCVYGGVEGVLSTWMQLVFRDPFAGGTYLNPDSSEHYVIEATVPILSNTGVTSISVPIYAQKVSEKLDIFPKSVRLTSGSIDTNNFLYYYHYKNTSPQMNILMGKMQTGINYVCFNSQIIRKGSTYSIDSIATDKTDLIVTSAGNSFIVRSNEVLNANITVPEESTKLKVYAIESSTSSSYIGSKSNPFKVNASTIDSSSVSTNSLLIDGLETVNIIFMNEKLTLYSNGYAIYQIKLYLKTDEHAEVFFKIQIGSREFQLAYQSQTQHVYTGKHTYLSSDNLSGENNFPNFAVDPYTNSIDIYNDSSQGNGYIKVEGFLEDDNFASLITFIKQSTKTTSEQGDAQ